MRMFICIEYSNIRSVKNYVFIYTFRIFVLELYMTYVHLYICIYTYVRICTCNNCNISMTDWLVHTVCIPVVPRDQGIHMYVHTYQANCKCTFYM